MFEKWRNELHCDQCRKHIHPGKRRWKAKKVSNFDICEKCITDVLKDRVEAKEDYYELENPDEAEVLHHYHRCDSCGVEPIWGTRFKCLVCENIDLCENCLDQVVESRTGCAAHAFQPIELPVVGHGLPVHVGKRCIWCLQKPILGPCFICADCTHLVLCQNCFFNASEDYIKVKGHEASHRIEMMTQSSGFATEKCATCGKTVRGKRFKCQQCSDFALCELCYISRDNASFANGHTAEHSYTTSF